MDLPPPYPLGGPPGPPRALPPPELPMPMPAMPAIPSTPSSAPTPPGKASTSDGTKWLLVMLAGLTAGLVGTILGIALVDRQTPRPRATSVPIVRPSDQVAGTPLDVAGIVAKVQPSVVNISVTTPAGHGVGTGVILSTAGEVVTNAHVVEGATAVRVRLVGETEPRPATVVASDLGNDIALLRIDDSTGLVPAELAAVGDVQVGDDVVALGYALDLDGGPSVTKGIISALDRTLPIDDNVLDGLIQTDAAISSGNSGGPLVNNRGQVVGINTAVARGGINFDANNIGFAIGLAEVLPILDEMRAGSGTGPAPFLGVKIDDRTDGGGGALITEVVEGAPAAAAGMAVGDIVVAVNGQPINGSGGLIAAIRDSHPGDVLRLEIERNGVHQTVLATLVERTPND